MSIVSLEAARNVEGVIDIVTAADLPAGLRAIPCRIPCHGDMSPFLQHVFAQDVVRYVGDPIALVIATSRAIAEDAAELIDIHWDPLPPVPDYAAALRIRKVEKLHPAGNIASQWSIDIGDVDAEIRKAAAVVRETFSIQRHSAMPLETRGLLAHYDRARHSLEVFGPTKVPHTNYALLAAMLKMPEGSIRFIEPDVGGSFGARGEFYPKISSSRG